MNRAQGFLTRESLNLDLRSQATDIQSRLIRFLSRFEMQINDEESDSLRAASLTLETLRMDEKGDK